MWFPFKRFFSIPRQSSTEDSNENISSTNISKRSVQARRFLKTMRSAKLNSSFQGAPQLRQRHKIGLSGYMVSSIPATVRQTYLSPAVRFAGPWWTSDEVVKDKPLSAHDHGEGYGDTGSAEDGQTSDDTKEMRIQINLLDGTTIHEIRDIKYDAVTKRRYKELWVEWPDGTRGNYNSVPTSLLPLIGVEDLNLSGRGGVFVTEGWFPAKALLDRGKAAVGTITGALRTPSDSALLPILRAKTIFLWPDNDDVGVLHMQRIASRLHTLGAKDIRVVRWVGAPRKADAADFTGTDDELNEIIDSAVKWQPSNQILSGGVLPVRFPVTVTRLGLASGSKVPSPRVKAEFSVNQQHLQNTDSTSVQDGSVDKGV